MAELKPLYLLHGDDHGALAERRAGLRALAERSQGAGASVEVLEGATPAEVARALDAMTLSLLTPDPDAIGRVIMVDGVERWREAEIRSELAPSLAHIPPATTLALFAREESRARAPAALHEIVRRAGGQVIAQMTVKPWELPAWVREQAARIGLSLDNAAVRALIAQVGERQQRLLRELEKLALEDPPSQERPSGRSISAEQIEGLAARSAELRIYELADALLGASTRGATLTYLRLRGQGEGLVGLIYVMAGRLRDGLAVALRLQAGESVAEIKRGLRMPSRAAEEFIADVARSDPERLRGALAILAELELDSRGGQPLPGSRRILASLDEDTLALRAIEAITA